MSHVGCIRAATLGCVVTGVLCFDESGKMAIRRVAHFSGTQVHTGWLLTVPGETKLGCRTSRAFREVRCTLVE